MSTGQTFLNKFSKVSPTGLEWARIEYHLQLSLGSTCATVKNIWSIASGTNSYNFEKNNKDVLTLDCWSETCMLDENNRLEKICFKGFDFASGGLLFPTGQIKLNDNQFGKNKIYEFLLLKIAVGKSYCLPSKTTNKDKVKLPYGFDSIYLYNEDQSNVEDSFKNDYILFDNSQVLPCFIVHFEMDPKKEEAITPPFCELCKETKANVYCRADDICLCYDCDEEHHAKGGKLVARHQRVSVHEKPKTFGECSQHPESKLELFCNICHVAICVYCKINGSHSLGEPSTHPVVKITDAYNKAIAESKEIDPLLEKRKNQLADLLSQIEHKIKEISKNYTFIEERIYQILQEALLQLQEESHKKMTYLIGDQLELKRQHEQIRWLESFLKYQQDILHPSDYLNNWGRHLLLRNEVLSSSAKPSLTNVQADIKLEGKLNVVSESTLRKKADESYFGIEKTNSIEDGNLSNSSKFRSNLFSKHNLSEKNSKIKKNLMGKISSFTREENKQSTFNGSFYLDPNLSLNNDTLNKSGVSITVKSSEAQSPLIIQKKLSLRPSPSLNEVQDYSPPEKNITIEKISPNKLKQATSKYQSNNIVEENDDEEGDKEEENRSVRPAFNILNTDQMSEINLLGNNSTSLSQAAKEKQNNLKGKFSEKGIKESLSKVFKNSSILTDKEAQVIYLNLPGLLNFDTELIYTFKNQENLEKSLSNNSRFPMLIVGMNGAEKYGGFASEAWDLNKNKNMGDKSCFLFNLRKDAKIFPSKTNNSFLFQVNNSFGFGNNDLAFQNDFEKCSSELENCYSYNLQAKSDEARHFLAGSHVFKPDALEIWSLSNSRLILDY